MEYPNKHELFQRMLEYMNLSIIKKCWYSYLNIRYSFIYCGYTDNNNLAQAQEHSAALLQHFQQDVQDCLNQEKEGARETLTEN